MSACDAHRGNGVPARVEEIVLHADRAAAQHLPPHLRDDVISVEVAGRAATGKSRSRMDSSMHDGDESLAIQLTAWRDRQSRSNAASRAGTK